MIFLKDFKDKKRKDSDFGAQKIPVGIPTSGVPTGIKFWSSKIKPQRENNNMTSAISIFL